MKYDGEVVLFFLLEHPEDLPDSSLACGALRMAAAYQLHCKFRRRPDQLQGEAVVWRALDQALREAVRGHRKTTEILDRRWVLSRQTSGRVMH